MKVKIFYIETEVYTLEDSVERAGREIDIPDDKLAEWQRIEKEFAAMQHEMMQAEFRAINPS